MDGQMDVQPDNISLVAEHDFVFTFYLFILLTPADC